MLTPPPLTRATSLWAVCRYPERVMVVVCIHHTILTRVVCYNVNILPAPALLTHLRRETLVRAYHGGDMLSRLEDVSAGHIAAIGTPQLNVGTLSHTTKTSLERKRILSNPALLDALIGV